MDSLIGFWREMRGKLDKGEKDFIHDKDRKAFEGREDILIRKRGFSEYWKDAGFYPNDKRFHVNLLPVPYSGNLEKARVFILTLNPGFAPLDYLAEYENSNFRKAQISMLLQEEESEKFPYLNPKFSWHGGWDYWTKKGRLGGIIEEVSNRFNYTHKKSLSIISEKIAVLELVPYHSRFYKRKSDVFKKLKSPKVMKEFVHEELAGKAKKGEVYIVCTRSGKDWDFDKPKHSKCENIKVYGGGECRGGYLSGVKGEIIEFLKKDILPR